MFFFLYTLELRGLRDPQQVECYQDQAQIMLGDYIRRHFPGQQVRFGKLLLMLPSLRMVNPKTIEELFFRQTIGSVAIESLLCDMFKSSWWARGDDFITLNGQVLNEAPELRTPSVNNNSEKADGSLLQIKNGCDSQTKLLAEIFLPIPRKKV